MIIDSIDNINKYYNINPLFKKAIEFIKDLNLKTIEVGRIEIQSDDIFAIISECELKNSNEAQIEAHKKYIDIQIPISKTEKFGWIPKNKLKEEIGVFDKKKDIQFFKDKPELFFKIKPKNFVIFFPDDGHAPCIGKGKTKKIILKIKSNTF